MRTYLAALVVFAGLCERRRRMQPTFQQEARFTGNRRSGLAVHLALRDHRLRLGNGLAGQAGVGPFPTSPFFINFLKILQHFQGGLMTSFVARNDTFIAGFHVILSRIGGGSNFRDPTSALFGDHGNLTLTQGIFTAFGGLRIPSVRRICSSTAPPGFAISIAAPRSICRFR